MRPPRALVAIAKRARGQPALNALVTDTLRTTLALAGRHASAELRDWIVRHVHRTGLTRVPLPNGRTLHLWSRGDDWVSTQVYWRGWDAYEPDTVPIFYRLACTARRTLDVGAYVGYFALLAAHANPSGEVLAFEPHPTIHARLERNRRENGLLNLTCVNAAVGVRAGDADFWVCAADDAMPTSSSLSHDFMAAHGTPRAVRVPVVTLDEYLGDRGPVDLVKIDTESTEPDVLAGMRAILTRDRPNIVLGPLGYRYYLLGAGGTQHRERIAGDPVHLNYLFSTLPPAAVARL
jgi:FkbM family methyltransferase